MFPDRSKHPSHIAGRLHDFTPLHSVCVCLYLACGTDAKLDLMLLHCRLTKAETQAVQSATLSLPKGRSVSQSPSVGSASKKRIASKPASKPVSKPAVKSDKSPQHTGERAPQQTIQCDEDECTWEKKGTCLKVCLSPPSSASIQTQTPNPNSAFGLEATSSRHLLAKGVCKRCLQMLAKGVCKCLQKVFANACKRCLQKVFANACKMCLQKVFANAYKMCSDTNSDRGRQMRPCSDTNSDRGKARACDPVATPMLTGARACDPAATQLGW